MDELPVQIDQCCVACEQQIACEGHVARFEMDGGFPECTATWDCPECGEDYEHTMEFDVGLFERSGFHSWVGSLGDFECCVVVDGRNVVGDEGEMPWDSEGERALRRERPGLGQPPVSGSGRRLGRAEQVQDD